MMSLEVLACRSRRCRSVVVVLLAALIGFSPSRAENVGGVITSSRRWTTANSPYVVTSTVTVTSGVTLTIDPGVNVLFNQGFGMIVNGRMLAEGTPDQRIRFAPNEGAISWTRLEFRSGTAQSRLAYVDVDGATTAGNVRVDATSIYLDHVVFTNTLTQLVDMTSASCVIQFCQFPSIQNNELLHFSGMPASGHAILSSNLFGTPGKPATTGYNDIIDFTGGNRPGPIVQFTGNVFLSGVDDCFDMDGTDAHIEGNIFLNVRQDAARDSTSSPITTGADGSRTSELVICRNVFFNCEHMLLLKDSGTALVQNNTIVRVLPNPLARQPAGIILFGEPHRGAPYGDGAIFEGNIVADLQSEPFPLFSVSGGFLQVTQSLIQGTNWPGEGNLSGDPLLVSTSGVTHENIVEKLALQPGSPCIGTGPNGLDMGAIVPAGATISGEPVGTTSEAGATLKVAGPGIFSYKWRLNENAWSDEVPLTTNLLFTPTMFANAKPIVLTNLAGGTYVVEVLGKNSAGVWQTVPTRSRSWTVASGSEDSDGDGMPDEWERANGFDERSYADGLLDADGDGLLNRDEFRAGTDPRNPASALTVKLTLNAAKELQFEFTAQPGRAYAIEWREKVTEGAWQPVEEVAPRSVVEVVKVTVPQTAAADERFYRLVLKAWTP